MKCNSPRGQVSRCDGCGTLSEKKDEFEKFVLAWQMGEHPITSEPTWNGIAVNVGGVHVPVDLHACPPCFIKVREASARKSLHYLKDILPAGPLKTILLDMASRDRLPRVRLLRIE